MKERITVLFVAACMMIFPLDCALARTLQVPGEYANIQDAVDAAESGDTVLVSDGIYSGPGNININFYGKSIALSSVTGPSNCVIDCENMGRAIYLVSSETREAVISGMTFRNGYGGSYGGAVYCSPASPTIQNCVIQSSKARYFGGGVYLNESNAVIMDSFIINNSVYDETSCSGGGIFVDTGSDVDIVRCEIRSNKAPNLNMNETQAGSGGGICTEYGSTARILDCLVSNNEVFGWMACGGGGMFLGGTALVANCLITDNQTFLDGGGVSAGFNSSSYNTIVNCTLAGNTSENERSSGIQGLHGDVFILNCILWDIGFQEIDVWYADLETRYSNIRGGYYGTGNIDANPGFFEGPLGDYYLKQIYSGQDEDSPCMDAGFGLASETCYNPPEGLVCMSDLTTRTDNGYDIGVVDMGYHYPDGTAIPTPTPTMTSPPTNTPLPTQTPTPEPTETPEPESTQTPTVTVSPTPDEWTGIMLALPGSPFQSGDLFRLTAICHPQTPREADVYVVLEVDGNYWFWPDWTESAAYERMFLQDAWTSLTIIEFIWPELDLGPMDGFRFWGAMLEAGTYQLIGDMDCVSFGFV